MRVANLKFWSPRQRGGKLVVHRAVKQVSPNDRQRFQPDVRQAVVCSSGPSRIRLPSRHFRPVLMQASSFFRATRNPAHPGGHPEFPRERAPLLPRVYFPLKVPVNTAEELWNPRPG